MSRGPQVSLEIQRVVKRLMMEGAGKTQIYAELDALGHISASGRPSRRTIERLVDRLKPADVSGLWSLAEEDDPEEAGLVLDVLASVYHRSNGRVWLTKDLAAWVVRLRRASPEMPVSWTYVLAWQYSAHANRLGGSEEPDLLDLVIALRPWERLGGVIGEGISVGGVGAILPWWGEDSTPALRRLEPIVDELLALVKDIEREPHPVLATPITTPKPAHSDERA